MVRNASASFCNILSRLDLPSQDFLVQCCVDTNYEGLLQYFWPFKKTCLVVCHPRVYPILYSLHKLMRKEICNSLIFDRL